MQTNPMNERVKFIADYLQAEETFSELCELYGISRKTGYKWVERYHAGGVTVLADKSRRPHTHPQRIEQKVIDAILEIRDKHPTWGPKKILVVLERREVDFILPAASTVSEMLKRHGRSQPRKRVRRSAPYAEPMADCSVPNQVWCADFKGHFPVAGDRCHPLTISDGFSRYLLLCKALKRTSGKPAREQFEATFREFGLPDSIRTDNGAPFSSLAPGGLSSLAVWWIRLGIKPERIMPGHPEQNGRHERMHRTLKAEATKPPRTSFAAQQRAFDKFREEYNNVRPHEALGQGVPSSFYHHSSKPFPLRLQDPEYPDHFRIERAYPNGVISFESIQWYISGCLSGEMIGLEQVDEDRWRVFFGPVLLGVLDVRSAKRRGCRGFGVLVRSDGVVNGARRAKRGRPRLCEYPVQE